METIDHKIRFIRGMRIEGYRCVEFRKWMRDFESSPRDRVYRHYITIDGVEYVLLSGSRSKWVVDTDEVSFEWRWDDWGMLRTIDRRSWVTYDKGGRHVVRGGRRRKNPRVSRTLIDDCREISNEDPPPFI